MNPNLWFTFLGVLILFTRICYNIHHDTILFSSSDGNNTESWINTTKDLQLASTNPDKIMPLPEKFQTEWQYEIRRGNEALHKIKFKCDIVEFFTDRHKEADQANYAVGISREDKYYDEYRNLVKQGLAMKNRDIKNEGFTWSSLEGQVIRGALEDNNVKINKVNYVPAENKTTFQLGKYNVNVEMEGKLKASKIRSTLNIFREDIDKQIQHKHKTPYPTNIVKHDVDNMQKSLAQLLADVRKITKG